jgi:hypothetical protein
VSFGEHGAVADQDGTDRDLADGGGVASLRQRALHVVDVVMLTGR